MPTDEVILFNGHPEALTKHHKASELSRLNWQFNFICFNSPTSLCFSAKPAHDTNLDL